MAARRRDPKGPSFSFGRGAPSTAPPDATPGGQVGAGSGKFKTQSSGRFAIPSERLILLALRCEVGSDLLEALRVFVTAYATQRFRPSVAHAVSLAGYELLENALSYGSVSGDVEFVLVKAGAMLVVEVSNDAVASRVNVLTERAARLRDGPETAYLEEMARSASGSILRPMLGLARVCHEGRMQLDVTVDDRRVTVSASCLA